MLDTLNSEGLGQTNISKCKSLFLKNNAYS